MKRNLFARAASAVLAAVCIVSFGGCARKDNMQPYTPSTALSSNDEVSSAAATLVSACGFTDKMTEKDSESITLFFGIVAYAANGSLYCGESSDQLVTVLKAADGMEVGLERMMISYIKRRISSATDADAKALMEKYVLKSGSGYVILVVSPDSEAAEAAVDSVMAELGAN